MPSRAIKNKTRGKTRSVQVGKSDQGPRDAVNTYDGRKNTNAGSYEQRFDGDAVSNGRTVDWKK